MRATSLYLFQCRDTNRYAISIDKTGANIPPTPTHPHWLVRGELSSGELAITNAGVLDEVVERGFAIFDGPPQTKLK